MQRIITVTPHAMFAELCPFVIISIEIVSAYNSEIVQNIIAKIGTNVDHD